MKSEGLSKDRKDIEEVVHYQDFLYILKVIHSELISKDHNNLIAGYFSIKKTRELIAKQYYWPILQQDIKAYVKGCDICLASKAVYHNLYGDLQSLLISTYR